MSPPEDSLIDSSEISEVLQMDTDGKVNWLVNKVHLIDLRVTFMYDEWTSVKQKAYTIIASAVAAVFGINILL